MIPEIPLRSPKRKVKASDFRVISPIDYIDQKLIDSLNAGYKKRGSLLVTYTVKDMKEMEELQIEYQNRDFDIEAMNGILKIFLP